MTDDQRNERSHVGFRRPSAIPIGKPHDNNRDPFQRVNQLQFNLRAPYSINALATSFRKPQPLVIEKFPCGGPAENPGVPQSVRIPASPASSVSSDRLHLAVQLAKIDAKKLWQEQKEIQESEAMKERRGNDIKQNGSRKTKTTQVKGTKKLNQDVKGTDVDHMQYKSKKDREVKRNVYGHLWPSSKENENISSEEKQTREVRRLEKQIQNYLQRLDDLIHKGQEVIQKKDKRFHVRRRSKDDASHLSDEDADPRQFERAEEQATRSARVLYMIERQIRELEEEIRKKGKNVQQSKKSETLRRLAAAQRATVRALRMLINSAPLQPKKSQHYPTIYQALTSLIHQLSLLSIQIEEGQDGVTLQNETLDDPFNKPSKKGSIDVAQSPSRLGILKTESVSNSKHAFSRQLAEKEMRGDKLHPKFKPAINEPFPDDSAITVDPSPERSATLKAGLEALLRAKVHSKKKTSEPTLLPTNTKKSVLFPSSLQAKRRKANAAVKKSVKCANETAHFTKETTASRLKKVERQKATLKGELKPCKRHDGDVECVADVARVPELKVVPERWLGIDHAQHEREIQRQTWLEDESRRKLREVMDIPKSLISEAEKAIKRKLKPILDQAQAVVDSSKAKPVQKKLAEKASKVTMQKNEVLSEMILDDLLLDTAQEFQRLERSDDDTDSESSYLRNASTLDNILQRLEDFEKEEESIRRHLGTVSYSDAYEAKQRYDIKSFSKDERQNVFTKNEDTTKRPSEECSTGFKSSGKPPVPCFLPPEVRQSIFSYKQQYSKYLQKANADKHGTFDPWQFIERLSDNILDELIFEVANEFTGACDDIVEMIFESEFMKE